MTESGFCSLPPLAIPLFSSERNAHAIHDSGEHLLWDWGALASENLAVSEERTTRLATASS